MASSTATLSNPQYFYSLLKLGRALHRDISIQVTILPPSTEGLNGTRLVMRPVKRAVFDSFPQTFFPDEWREEMYSSTDKIAQLWVGFYHMIEERREGRIFGGRFENFTTLYEKVRALNNDFVSGRPVSIFLSDLYIADEFVCVTSPGNALADAFERLRSIANEEGMKLYDHATRDVSAQAPPTEITEAVDLSDNGVRVWEPRLGLFRVETAVPDPSIDNNVRRALLHYLHAIQSSRHVSYGLDIQQLHKFNDCYFWNISVSDLIAHTSSLSPGVPPFHTAALGVAAVAHYRHLAAAAWYCTWRRVAALLPILGSVPDNYYLRFLHDYVGPDIATRIAAVGSLPSPQHHVLHISYSAFAYSQPADKDSVSLAISSSGLRDVGRLSVDDNLIRPPLMTGLNPLVITSGPSGLMITSEHSPSLVKKGRLTDEVKIC